MRIRFDLIAQYILFAILICVLGFFFYRSITTWGAIVGFDSYTYLRSAEGLISNLAMGWKGIDSMVIHSNHYPPMYSAVIAITSLLFHLSILEAARWVVVGCSIVLLILIIMIFFDLHVPIYVAALFISIFFTNSQWIEILLNAMSEGVFFVFFFGYLFAMQRFLRNGKKRYLIFAGITAGFTLLTRYAAVSVLISGFLTILLLKNEKFTVRGISAVLFGILSSLPIIIWMLYENGNLRDSSARKISFHLPAGEQWMTIPKTIKNWVSPLTLSDEMQLILLVIILIVFLTVIINRILAYRVDRKLQFDLSQFSLMLSIFLVIYPVTLLVSYTLFDASTTWGNRILSPWFITAFLLFLINIPLDIYSIQPLTKRKIIGWVSIFVILILTLIKLPTSIDLKDEMVRRGSGFTAKDMQRSEMITKIRNTSSESIIYTNNVPAIYFNTGHDALALPEKVNTITATGLSYYQFEMDRMHQRIRSSGGFLVIFRPYNDKNGILPTVSELTEGMKLYQKFSDGSIYINDDRAEGIRDQQFVILD